MTIKDGRFPRLSGSKLQEHTDTVEVPLRVSLDKVQLVCNPSMHVDPRSEL